MMRGIRRFALAALLCAWASTLVAQGTQTATIRGTVDTDGQVVPGATVKATSPALQGVHTTTTDANGAYILPLLPAGDYTITFALDGYETITHTLTVPLAGVVEQRVSLRVSGRAEAQSGVIDVPSEIALPTVGTNLTHDLIEQLATLRTPQSIASLAPAVNEHSTAPGRIIISGGLVYDNLFLVNGVDIGDNLSGNAQNLFIEDAIAETAVLSSSISAEYGRFGGGVVNAVTKSGGNRFSGSVRVNFLNPAWSTETPYEVSRHVTRPDDLQQTYEATLGGPVVRDRLWFFAAGRRAAVQTPVTLQQTGIQIIQDDNNKRGEIKLTGTINGIHSIQGGYLNNARTESNGSSAFNAIIDPASLVTRSLPNAYYYTNYRGVLGGGTLLEAQYSQRHFEFQGDGGTSTNILDSPFYSPALNVVYHAPYFSALDPEQRNNFQGSARVTNFWNQAGQHQTKSGYEFFRSQRIGGGSQSATQYVFNTDYLTDASGLPVRDSQGRIIPVFIPGDSAISFFPAVVGATLNVDINSLYVQDHWSINGRWSADLGARYEHVKALTNGDILSVNTNRIVPRLSTSYDILGNGQYIIHATYGQYSGRYNEAQIGGNSPVGNPADIFSIYQGPAGQGINFAPGLDVKNYPVNTRNTFFDVRPLYTDNDPGLKSPLIHEFTASYGVNINRGKGYAEAAYIYRKTTNIIEDFITRADGTTRLQGFGIDAGLVSKHVYRNTDEAHRLFESLVFQGRYQATQRWILNGQYTVQLTNDGNYEGDPTNAPGATSRIGDYPEAYNAARFFPDGRLQDFERHRLRAWTIYNLGMGRLGDVSVSGLWRYDSAQVYSLAALNQPLTPVQRDNLIKAGYPDLPGRSTVYFGPRGSETFEGYGLFDSTVTYNIPVAGSVRPWVKFDVFNLLNNQKQIAWDTTVRQDPRSPLDPLGISTGYIKATTFGTATSASQFPAPFGGATGGRTFRAAVGVRF